VTRGVDPATRDLLLEGERLLTFGLIDRAEAAFRRVAEDGRSAAALVGLSRAALERGDDGAAYRLAVEALAVDPDDEAALRMEARLSEVLAARGEPVERPAFVLERRSLLGRILRRG
jgi:hypothetical protein